MQSAIFIRPLTKEERHQIQMKLRSKDAFVLRRCQILLASDRGEKAPTIAQHLACHRQTVLDVIHGFNARGLAILQENSSRPHRLRTSFTDEALDALQDLLHHSPRDFGYQTSVWTLSLAAQVSFAQGLTPTLVSGESVRRALNRRGMSWKRARHWISSPDPQYLQKKRARDRLIAWASPRPDWAIGFLDEVWWSRFALPRVHTWQSKQSPMHLVEQSRQKDDPDPKALACYGVLWQKGSPQDPDRSRVWLRFVTGRPVSPFTIRFLDSCCQRLAAEGKRNWLLIWDNAPWHKSLMVRNWIRQHNQQVKQANKGVRILPFLLPNQSPWLNPIELKAGCMPRRPLSSLMDYSQPSN
jgi:transposase